MPNSQPALVRLFRDPQTDRELALETWRKSKAAAHISNSTCPSPADTSTLSCDDWDEPDQGEDVPMQSDPPATVPVTAELPQPPSMLQSPLTLLGLPLPHGTAGLVDAYFTHTHSWLPMVERHELLRTMYTYPGNSASPSSSHLLLWSVVAYTAVVSGLDDSSIPSSIEILHALHKQILVETDTLSLRHVQAFAILVLLELTKGNLHSAWTLCGQTVRLLALVEPADQARYKNTFHACAFLDAVISASINRTPSMSLEEQTSIGPVDEDGMEEWDSWPGRAQDTQSQQRTAGNGPLRSLSAFNQLRQLARILTGVLYCPSDSDSVTRDSVLSEIRELRTTIENLHPYHRVHSAPSILTLYMACEFTLLSVLRRFNVTDSRTTELLLASSQRLLDLLHDSAEMSGNIRSSPLPGVFALQCQRCLERLIPGAQSSETIALKSRLIQYQQQLSRPSITAAEVDAMNRMLAIPHAGDENRITADHSSSSTKPTPLNNTSQPGIAGLGRGPYATPLSTAPDILALPLSKSPLLAGDDGFDDLFEELVTSIPNTRLEPAFAHNLGFYGGDLDTDFLSQLQQPSGG
ncbi:fungal specific transcription factor domain-containing protein [Aspergillus mulundensis]|uniref:Xylanolytic transcriptional activator regulatory domain-containing protein n=1 Tax=Aspergillus mulundensis TaxID=1810919 RepID=A0A3D8RQG8_9EURO|nr:hypothetical protein DSM5745_06319 [Aspergillus mulundensis]RDW76327.1 hypothetical protein DSM5745_06319 [Aspergillus mulundensis]